MISSDGFLHGLIYSSHYIDDWVLSAYFGTQGHAVKLEFSLPRYLPYLDQADIGSIVFVRNLPLTRHLEPEVKYGLLCRLLRFAWLGLHEANDFKACATSTCLNGLALLDGNHQGKHILSLTLRQ